MIIRILTTGTNINLQPQVTRVVRVYNYRVPAGITEDIFTDAGQLLGSDGTSSPGVVSAPTVEGQMLLARLGAAVKMAWESVDLSQLQQTAVKTTAYTAIPNDHVLVDSSGAAADFEITLPSSPANGTKVRVSMVVGHATYKVTINRNGSNVMGGTVTTHLTLHNAGDSVYFEYTGATLGWIVLTNFHGLTRVTSSASITPTGSALRNYLSVMALAENTTINAPDGTPLDGYMLLMRIKDNGAGRTLTYNAIFSDVGVTRKSTTTANKTLYQLAQYNAANTKWDIISVIQEA